MGERTQFVPGAEAPNDGIYIEVGENDHVMGVNDPKQVTLKKGDKFPETTNQNRHWVNMRNKGRTN